MFKTGTTSYIYPDKILPNIKKLKGKVDDIELLLFERDPFKELSVADIKAMIKISNDFNLSYTVHLPLELDIANDDKNVRDTSISEICSIIKTLSIINPYAYIMHLKRNPDTSETTQGKPIKMSFPRKRESKDYVDNGFPIRALGNDRQEENWVFQQAAKDSLTRILKLTGIKPEKICIENTNYSLKYIYPVIEVLGLSVCLDIGHLINQKEDIKANLNAYINKIKVIHLCGIDEDGRHLSLKTMPNDMCGKIVKDIKESGFNGVLTLEVFSEKEYSESRNILDKEVVI